MKKVIMILISVAVAIFAERAWNYNLNVSNVVMASNEYYAPASDGVGKIVISTTNGKSFCFPHNDEITKLEFAKMYMSMALAAKASEKQINIISEAYNGDENIRRIVYMQVNE